MFPVRRSFPLSCLSLFLVLAGGVRGQVPVPELVRVTPLAENVWVHTAWHETIDWGRVVSNGLVVLDAGAVTVVDTAWGAEASQALINWISAELRRPVARLIVTHFHSDSMGGWEVFAATGAEIVASAHTVELAGIADASAFTTHRLQPGQRRAAGDLEILFIGGGHTPDNVVVWVPGARVLFGGCAVRSVETQSLRNTADASLATWAEAMAVAQRRYSEAEHVVPGHGAPGGPELLAHTRRLAEEHAGVSAPR